MNKFKTFLITCFIAQIFLGNLVMSQQNKKQNLLINAMTFNLRYHNNTDGANIWENRREWVSSLIGFYESDIVGCQEVLRSQLTDMLNMLPEFAYIGVGREDGKEKGEYSPLFFKKDKFEVQSSSTFWLSETPDIPGKGWDAAYERLVTWAKLKEKQSGKSFFVFNTHFDHMGETARKESAKLMLAKVKEIAGENPAIILGDFNSTPGSEAYKILTTGDNSLVDTHNTAGFLYGPSWTFHGFGAVPEENREKIDYIFVNQFKGFEIVKSAIISEQRGDLYPSDHCPLMVILKLKK